jgi:hypothetical protein
MPGLGMGTLPTQGLVSSGVPPALGANPNLSPGVLGGAGMMGYYRDRMGNLIASPGAGLFGGSRIPGFKDGGEARKPRPAAFYPQDQSMQDVIEADPDLAAFLRGAGKNLAGRGKAALEFAREMPGSAIDLLRQLGELGVSAVRDPKGTAAAMAESEVERARAAGESDEAAGEYAASYLSPASWLRALPRMDVKGRSTIHGAYRKQFPGIYDDPREVARRAEQRVAPESPNLQRVFGVSRQDLAEMADRPGDYEMAVPNAPANPRGSWKADRVMSPQNTQRLVDVLDASRTEAPELFRGMKGWYAMDPAFERLVQLQGPEQGLKNFTRFNALTSMASPASPVTTEFMRGTAANRLAQEGRFGEFREYGSLPMKKRMKMGLPEELTSFPSHFVHKTAQAPQMERFLTEGALPKKPKVPAYFHAAMPTGFGRQSNLFVGDAHWARGAGLADARPSRMSKGEEVEPDASISTAEAASLAPWFRKDVAAQVGLEAVPAQAIQWALYGPDTGVDTVLGAPKLEILSDLIAQTAQRYGMSLEEARDMVLTGRAQAGVPKGGADVVRPKKPKK